MLSSGATRIFTQVKRKTPSLSYCYMTARPIALGIIATEQKDVITGESTPERYARA